MFKIFAVVTTSASTMACEVAGSLVPQRLRLIKRWRSLSDGNNVTPLEITLTPHNVTNSSLTVPSAVRSALPADVIGGRSKREQGELVHVHFSGTEEVIETDIAGDKNILRARSEVGRFYAHHGLVAGDTIVVNINGPRRITVEPGTPTRAGGDNRTSAIADYVVSELLRRDLEEVPANEAAVWLDDAKLLTDSASRPGLPLRNLLRAGKLASIAVQRPARSNGRWYLTAGVRPRGPRRTVPDASHLSPSAAVPQQAGSANEARDVDVSDTDTVARIHPLVSSDLADDVLRAVVDLGGEAQRVEIMDRALEIGGWTDDELTVRARWKKAARPTHLRAVVDLAVDLSGSRGLLEPTGVQGRWRLPATVGELSGVGSAYRPGSRRALAARSPALAEIDLDGLDARTVEHMALQDNLAAALKARGFAPLSWHAPEPRYDLAFELDRQIVVVEVKTLTKGGDPQQMRLGAGQIIEYRHQMSALHQRPVRSILLASASPAEPWPSALAAIDIALLEAGYLDARLDRVIAELRTVQGSGTAPTESS